MENQENVTCPLCHQPIQNNEPTVACPDCHVTYHEKCWEENCGCATVGCPQQNTAAVQENPFPTCSNCGAVLQEGQGFCTQCGQKILAEQPRTCSNCGAVLQEGQGFCTQCGQKILAEQPRTCSNCGATLQEDQNFCSNCGQQYAPKSFSNHQIVCTTPVFSAAPNPAAAAAMAAPVKKSKKKFVVIGIVGAIMMATIITVAILIPSLLTTEDFRDMFGEYEEESWCEIATDGSWMRLDTNPNDYDSDLWILFYKTSSEAQAAIEEVNQELGFSSGVYQRMKETTALQGRQTESNDRYTVSWTYHPDKGLEVLYEIN